MANNVEGLEGVLAGMDPEEINEVLEKFQNDRKLSLEDYAKRHLRAKAEAERRATQKPLEDAKQALEAEYQTAIKGLHGEAFAEITRTYRAKARDLDSQKVAELDEEQLQALRAEFEAAKVGVQGMAYANLVEKFRARGMR